MDIIIIICAIILCVIIGIISYNVGHNQTVQLEEINNDKLKQERQQLIQENQRIQQEFDFKQKTIQDAEKLRQEKLNSLQKEYQSKEQILQDALKQKEENFKITLENQKSRMYNDFEEKKLKIKIETEALEHELTQMRKARKATIEANKRAAAVQEDKENYSLQINAADANDIRTLESIRHLLVKPRILSMLIWQTYYQPLAKKLFPRILGQGKVCGIYKITNSETEECYIGQAVSIGR